MKKIVITGGAGFIGSWVLRELFLRYEDAEFAIIDNLCCGSSNTIERYIATDRVILYEVDLKNIDKIQHIFKDATDVYHFAANADIAKATTTFAQLINKKTENFVGNIDKYRKENDVNGVSDLLTDIGLEVEKVNDYEFPSTDLSKLLIGLVKESKKHPNADRLKVTKVDIGGNKDLTIVCGAPNVSEGQKVVVAPVGTNLITSTNESFKISFRHKY